MSVIILNVLGISNKTCHEDIVNVAVNCVTSRNEMWFNIIAEEFSGYCDKKVNAGINK